MTAPAHHDYHVKDINLADYGRREIEIAETASVGDEFSTCLSL